MSRPNYYSPRLNRFLITVLYHEAKRRKQPMTVLADELLEQRLRQTQSWRTAEAAMQLNDSPPAPAGK